jgi:hypothetical protein
MIRIFMVVIQLIFFLSSYCYAEMYIWVDKNGVKHFTDSPPNQDVASSGQIKQVETAKYRFNHPIYKKQGDQEFCGDYRLPAPKSDDPKKIIENSTTVYENAKNIRRNLTSQIASTSSESFRKALQKTLDEYECALEWSLAIIDETKNAQP